MQQFHRLLSKLLILLLVFSSTSLFSQKYFFSNYSIKEGLAHSQIKDIVQDSNGYIWLGTKIGLSKFDGEKFNNFSSKDGLAEKGVSTICIDNNGVMWMGHFFGGLSIYRDGKFTEIILDSNKSDITSIVQDSLNRIWISTYGDGVYRIDEPLAKKINVSAHFTSKEGLGNLVMSMTSTQSLGMIYVTRYGVKYFNDKINEWELVNDKFYAWPQYFNTTTIHEDSKKGIWVGTFNGGLYYYKDINTEPIRYDKRDGLANNWISEIVEDIDGSMWVGTWGGGISNINNGEILSLNESNGLSENKVKRIYVDFEGNVLIGTYSEGLSVFKSFAFIHYRKIKKDKAIKINAIYESAESDGVWLGTNNGLYYMKESNNGGFSTEVFRKNDLGLQSDDIRYLKADKEHLWIGTYGGGVSKLNFETKKLTYVYVANTILLQASNFENVSAMDIDKEGHLWIGSPAGVIYYEPENDQANFLTQGNNLQSNDISSIYCDNDNIVWVGHVGNGISRIEGSKITRYEGGAGLTPSVIYKIKDDLLVGTEGDGLFVFNKSKEIKHYTMASGLISNMVVALQEDKNGVIYCGTSNGLVRIDSKTDEISSYGEDKGFEGVEVMHGSMFMSKYNIMWVGTAIGLTKVNTRLLKTKTQPPITFITKFRVNLEEVSFNDNKVFNYNENAVLIDYKSICISDAPSVVYKVRLIGAEEEWQPETKQSYSNFPALPPGEYRFEVIARNNSGVWNEKAQSIAFTINPPFWQTFWFISILLIVVVISVVLFIKVREKNLLKEKAELENKVQERTVEISQKNSLLAQKNKDITDSINYARRIQRAIMPTDTDMKRLLKSSFIYYKPKDIVSGDFYWNAVHNGRLVVAAADCTGHGVPGAFMSMISISSLNKIVKEKQIVDPSRILDNMRHDIVNDLKQSGEQAKDGLDIALLSIEVEKRLVHFAGAYNSMYIIKKNKINEDELSFDFPYSVFGDYLLEVKADRMPIGISERMERNFTTKSLQLDEGDRIYISTDGYIDQFGGVKGKKFMSKRFKKLLLELPYSSDEESVQILDNQFIEWRGIHEQIDDVLVIGICF